MGISGISDYYLNTMTNTASSKKSEALANTLSSSDMSKATDTEMLEACQTFEAYLVEQMLKGMEKTIPKDEEDEENDYLTQFGDMLYTSVAEQIAENGELGLAQQLYESMKRN
ncbi:MAG: rod-binding protein [Lachnospiraceae bacterium]|nr:rod-binding protein [Lachnospiraceae bacterium]